MIFTYYYFEKSKLPKYYGRVAKMMRSVKNSVFLDDDDIKRLHALLKKLLYIDKPIGSTAYVDLYYSCPGKSGCIYVYPGKDTDKGAVLRIQFERVDHVLRYDEPTDHFTSVETELLTGKGGEV